MSIYTWVSPECKYDNLHQSDGYKSSYLLCLTGAMTYDPLNSWLMTQHSAVIAGWGTAQVTYMYLGLSVCGPFYAVNYNRCNGWGGVSPMFDGTWEQPAVVMLTDRPNMEVTSSSRLNLSHSTTLEYLSIWRTLHIHLAILISAWAKANSFFLTSHVLLTRNIQLLTQLRYAFPCMCMKCR